MRPILNTYNLLFLWNPVRVAISRLRIFTQLLLIVAGVAQDVLGNWEVQLFRHTYTGGFLLFPEECCKCDTCHLPNHLELLYTLHHRNLGWATHSTKKKQGKSEKQILIDQTALGSGKWEF
jgi:hypothetical protein